VGSTRTSTHGRCRGVVSGVVLVDSSGPPEIERLRQERAPLLIRATNEAFETFDSVFKRNRFPQTASVDETIRQIRAAGPFPTVPLIVVSGSGRMRLVPVAAFRGKSGHFPQIDEPEIVIDAIRELVDTCRTVA